MLSVLERSVEHFGDQLRGADFADAVKLLQHPDLRAAVDGSFGLASLNELLLQALELGVHEIEPFKLAAKLTEDEPR